jgi:hypothetical protein
MSKPSPEMCIVASIDGRGRETRQLGALLSARNKEYDPQLA